MSEIKPSDLDPYLFRAPVPKFVRWVIALTAFGSFGLLLTLGISDREVPQLPSRIVSWVCVGSFALGFLVRIADWLTWRFSPDYRPGLRKKKMDQYLQTSRTGRGILALEKAAKWFFYLTIAFASMVLIAIAAATVHGWTAHP